MEDCCSESPQSPFLKRGDPNLAPTHPTSTGYSPDTPPEKLHTPEIVPDVLPQGIAIIRQQSDAKDAEETPAAHPGPAGSDELEELDRMLASAESLSSEQRKGFYAWFTKNLARRTTLSDTRARRETLWIMETLSQPRMSILGRYLHDNKVTSDHKLLKILPTEVYEEIFRKGPHHLDETAQKHLASSNSRERASYCSKGVLTRIKLLLTGEFVTGDSKKYWLTSLGARVFNRWPWWSSRDDDREPRFDSEPSPPPRSGKRKPS